LKRKQALGLLIVLTAAFIILLIQIGF